MKNNLIAFCKEVLFFGKPKQLAMGIPYWALSIYAWGNIIIVITGIAGIIQKHF